MNDTIHIWDDIKNVIILTKDSLDHKLSLVCAVHEIKEMDPDINVFVIDCTDKGIVPPAVENPASDTIILFLGFIPSMMYLQRTVELVGIRHVIYIDNDETEIKYLKNLETCRHLPGLRVPGFTVSTLTYWYFVLAMRYAKYSEGTLVYCNKFDRPMELTDTRDKTLLIESIEWKPIPNSINFIKYPMTADSTDYGYAMVYQAMLPESLTSIVAYEGYYDHLAHPVTEEDIMQAIYYNNTIDAINSSNAFNATLRKSEHLKVIAINALKCNGRVLSKFYDDYHLGISFAFNGLMWYRVWRLGKEKEKFINVRKIAEAYGGHGSENYGEFKTTGQLEVLPIK